MLHLQQNKQRKINNFFTLKSEIIKEVNVIPDYKEIIAISTSSYAGYSLPVALEHIMKIGFKQVEIAATSGQVEHLSPNDFNEKGANRINQLLEQNGLSNTAFSGHIFITNKNAVDVFKPRMEFTKAIGAKIINTKAGSISEIKSFYKNLKKLVEFAEEIKLKIGLETNAGSEDIVHDGISGLGVIEKFSSDFLVLTYDCGNVFVNSGGRVDTAVEFEKILDLIGHIHLKDVLKENGTDFWKMCVIGDGILNYDQILKHLRQLKNPISTTIELPFCIKMHESGKVKILSDYMQLFEIDKILKKSYNYVLNVLSN